MNWKPIHSPIGNIYMWRTPIVGGWLVCTSEAHGPGSASCFVPDPNAEWELYDVRLESAPEEAFPVVREIGDRQFGDSTWTFDGELRDWLSRLPRVLSFGATLGVANSIAAKLRTAGAKAEVKKQAW